MNPFQLKSSTRNLVNIQTRASRQRMLERLRSPRRLVLTLIGLALSVVWIGQAIAGIVFRESADPERLKIWIPFSLTAYAIWNVIKVSCRKRIEPFEWTPAERELLIAAPIERAELIRYRMTSIVRAALFKSTIFMLVMIPDLSLLPLGFLGMFGGLMLIDLIRMLMEVGVWGLRPREFNGLRISTIAICMIGLGTVLYRVAYDGGGFSIEMIASLGFLFRMLASVTELFQSGLGQLISTPFRLAANVILTQQISATALISLLGLGLMIGVLFRILLVLDTWSVQRRKTVDIANLPNARQLTLQVREEDSKVRNRIKPIRLGGVGPLAWRQLLGAKAYRAQLLIALAVPMILSCFPALSGKSGLLMLMSVVGGLAFYSFLLLPTTLPFDMRRDYDRFVILKSLPISPFNVVSGQLAAPVLLTTLFQFCTLVVTFLFCPYHPGLLILSMAILIPFNLFVFGFENLVAIWYPYRMNKEGIQVFVRSILSFTAKGILFVLASLAMLAWVYTCKWFALNWPADQVQFVTAILFGIGVTLGLSVLAGTVVSLLARSFRNLDPSCDLAGLD